MHACWTLCVLSVARRDTGTKRRRAPTTAFPRRAWERETKAKGCLKLSLNSTVLVLSDPAWMRLGDDDRLESLIAADRFEWPHLVDPLTIGAPVPLAKLEEGGCMPGHRRQVEGIGLEFDADERQQVVSLTIARP
jgi:hypothetical protein